MNPSSSKFRTSRVQYLSLSLSVIHQTTHRKVPLYDKKSISSNSRRSFLYQVSLKICIWLSERTTNFPLQVFFEVQSARSLIKKLLDEFSLKLHYSLYYRNSRNLIYIVTVWVVFFVKPGANKQVLQLDKWNLQQPYLVLQIKMVMWRLMQQRLLCV